MKTLFRLIFSSLFFFSLATFADDPPPCTECQDEQEPCHHDDMCIFHFERARPYDAELETETTWPGKRESEFYDWLTR